MKDSIRLIILDLDGTFYDLKDILPSVYETQIDFLCLKTGKSRDEAVAFLSEHHVYKERAKDSKSATELFLTMGINLSEWTLYRESNFDVSKIDVKKAVEVTAIEKLSSICKIVLLSSNARHIINKVLTRLDIPESLFTGIYCSDNFPFGRIFNKKSAIQGVAKQYDIPLNYILSIGDRYETDIRPVLDLGGQGVLLHNPKTLSVLYEYIRNGELSNCRECDFFTV